MKEDYRMYLAGYCFFNTKCGCLVKKFLEDHKEECMHKLPSALNSLSLFSLFDFFSSPPSLCLSFSVSSLCFSHSVPPLLSLSLSLSPSLNLSLSPSLNLSLSLPLSIYLSLSLSRFTFSSIFSSFLSYFFLRTQQDIFF